MVGDTLDVLSRKAPSGGALHGYGIAERIEEASEEVLRFTASRSPAENSLTKKLRAGDECWRRFRA